MKTQHIFWSISKKILDSGEPVFGISLGTPGVHRKPVIQIQDPAGEVVAYAKVGWNTETNRLIENEVRSLRSLAGKKFSFTVPEVIYAGNWKGKAICILTAPQLPESIVKGYLTQDVVSTVVELATFQRRTIRIKDSSYWRQLTERVARVADKYYLHILHSGIRQVELRVGETPLMFHLSHGDLAPWNAKRLDGQLFIIDWEHSQAEMPLGWDLFHFFFQTEWLLKRKSASETLRYLTGKSRLRANWSEYLESIGAERIRLETLALLYLVERLSFYAVETSKFAVHTLRYATLVQLITESTSTVSLD